MQFLAPDNEKFQMNKYVNDTEFQRITRRDKKTVFNEQCKEIEENTEGKN